MPRKKSQSSGNKPLPANQQKGKKVCTCCHDEKNLTDFYYSSSPMYSLDERIPVCKECCKTSVLSEDGRIDFDKFKDLLRNIDKPLYFDLLFSSEESVKKENSYLSDEEVSLHGYEILQKYFTLVAMRQDKAKSYSDAEKEGFIHQNSNRTKKEKDEILNRYSHLINQCLQNNKTPHINLSQPAKQESNVKWTKEDKQNMKYIISKLGYDPFEDVGLDEFDRKYCFNLLSGYFDTPGILEDGHKKQCVIEITMSYCQCRKITDELNTELSKPDSNEKRITSLTNAKYSLLSSIATIAKDNNISSNYNKNSNQGQDSISSMMKEMEKNGFQEIQVNLFDIKTSEAFKQIDDISNQNIANQLTLDNNEYSDIVREQRDIIKNLESEVDRLKEENRNLKNQIIDLENKKR